MTLARADVHYVVTEFGIAYLFGKSVRERALALIGSASTIFVKVFSMRPSDNRLCLRPTR